MKRILLIGVIIFFVLVLSVAGFFLYKNVNKEQKPGKCLILDNRYCKELKMENFHGPIYRIKGILPVGTKIFSPVNGKCETDFTVIRSESERLTGVSVETLINEGNKNIYTLLFISSDCEGDINKGDIVGVVNENKKIEILVSTKYDENNVFDIKGVELNKKILENLIKE